MSRIGKKPVPIPAGVEVKVAGKNVSIKGPKGTLTQELNGEIGVEVDATAKEVRVQRNSDLRIDRAKHGLYRALIANMIEGVTKGYSKSLEIQGVGYRAQYQGRKLQLFVGYNTKIPEVYMVPEGITLTLGSPTEINIAGIDKQLVGQVAAKIRKIRKPEPYKGKGIRYSDERVLRKAGKSAK